MKDSGTLKIVVVGAGKHALHHMRAIINCPGVELAAVIDPIPTATDKVRAIFPFVEAYASVDELLKARKVDVAHVCTPPSTHFTIARQFLAAGVSVYVEKPFAESVAEAERLFSIAKETGAHVCAGHQLLFETPFQEFRTLRPALQEIVHVESFFSFKTVRRSADGRTPLRADLQLLDILPHPVYLVVEALRAAQPVMNVATNLEVLGAGLSGGGTLHALLRLGGTSATLIVSLEGRPVESYLKIVGQNGTVFCDFVRSTVVSQFGPGVSGIDKALNPFRVSWQLATRTAGALFRRVRSRKKSYPGLSEIFHEFYQSVRGVGQNELLSNQSIAATVAVWQKVKEMLAADSSNEARATEALQVEGPRVLVTGGTGLLGRQVVSELVARGFCVTAIARREPAKWDRRSGVTYLSADLATQMTPEMLAGYAAVVHTAAETAGSWDEHERNSIQATKQLTESAESAGVRHFIHVSSVAVLEADSDGLTRHGSRLMPDARTAGPYVWGKLESERFVASRMHAGKMKIKVIRPGPLVDLSRLDPPGRLGKRIGNVFVAIGSANDPIYVTPLGLVASRIADALENWESVPDVENVLESPPMTRGDLVAILKRLNPSLSVVRIPFSSLRAVSVLLKMGQRVARPGKKPIDVYQPFRSVPYEVPRNPTNS